MYIYTNSALHLPEEIFQVYWIFLKLVVATSCNSFLQYVLFVWF